MTVPLGKIHGAGITYPIPYSNKDALTDDAWIEQERKAQELKELEEIDVWVGDKTTAILTSLNELADGKKRNDIKAVLLSDKLSDSDECEIYHDYRFHPFQKQSNFNEQMRSEHPAQTLEALQGIISVLATILFGMGFSKKDSEDDRTVQQMDKDLHADIKIWKGELWKYYTNYYDTNMLETLSKAEILINERISYKRINYYQRITLYTSAILTSVGVITGKKGITYLGITASVVNMASMFYFYVSSSMKQANLASELQTSTDFLEKIGCKNRSVQNSKINWDD